MVHLCIRDPCGFLNLPEGFLVGCDLLLVFLSQEGLALLWRKLILLDGASCSLSHNTFIVMYLIDYLAV